MPDRSCLTDALDAAGHLLGAPYGLLLDPLVVEAHGEAAGIVCAAVGAALRLWGRVLRREELTPALFGTMIVDDLVDQVVERLVSTGELHVDQAGWVILAQRPAR